MKVSEIYNAYFGLMNVINNEDNNGKKILDRYIPTKISYLLRRNLIKMEEVIKEADESKQKLLEKYGEKKEDGTLNVNEENGSIRIAEGEKFTNEFNDMMNANINFVYDKITAEDILKCGEDGYDKLSFGEVNALSFMIDDGDSTNEQ